MMWKKPIINKANFERKDLKELYNEEISQIKGGVADNGGFGTCAIVGYYCYESGAFHIGTCLGVGVGI